MEKSIEEMQKRLTELKITAVDYILARLKKLWLTGFTGNITINCKHGVPRNYNVQYTSFQQRGIVKEVDELERLLIKQTGGSDE